MDVTEFSLLDFQQTSAEWTPLVMPGSLFAVHVDVQHVYLDVFVSN